MAKLNIVLHEPEIPANTGNIGRTCVATGTRLHLIEPLGFSLSEKALKRAGMDYWKDLDVTTYLDFEEFLEKNPGAKIYYATTKAPQTYTDVHYEEDCYIMFGKESAGIPEDILVNNQETCVRIPMIGDIRSLNLSNSVAIVLYEAHESGRAPEKLRLEIITVSRQEELYAKYHKSSSGRIPETASSEETSGQDHDNRYYHRLRDKPHGFLLSFQGYL